MDNAKSQHGTVAKADSSTCGNVCGGRQNSDSIDVSVSFEALPVIGDMQSVFAKMAALVPDCPARSELIAQYAHLTCELSRNLVVECKTGNG